MDFLKDCGRLALGSRLRRLSDRLMASGAEIYGQSGIDFEPRWFPVYRLLSQRGPMTVGSCARELGLTHAAVSQTARAMTERGVVTSRKDAADERRRLLELTDRGRDLLERLQDLWSDIDAGLGEVVDFGGVDILAALEGIEQALDEESLAQRFAQRREIRMLDAVEILDFEPHLREHFKDLNLEWVEKYFTVEPIDREVLWNPEAIVEDGGVILFARVEGQIVGTCALQRQGDAWELTKMAVTEEFKGRKIGKRLMLATLERARAMGIDNIYLVTNSSLTPAVTLYRKVGFRVTGCEKHPKYERGDLTMELSLA
jgi:DNA-binding MarR family transcriptional regulator/N-acetylglutamate synthase-like GNAT family acetyltransferase